MVGQTPSDAPFGLEPNIAAGLAYLLGVIGGIVMLVGGGTNKFVKWAACQSITFFIAVFLLYWIIGWAFIFVPFLALAIVPVLWLIRLAIFVGWLYLSIMAFQGKEVRLPVIGDLTASLFKTALS